MLGYRNSSEKNSYLSDVKLLESHGNHRHAVAAGCDDKDDGVGCHIIDDVDSDDRHDMMLTLITEMMLVGIGDSDDREYVGSDGRDVRQHKQYIYMYPLFNRCDYT